MSDDDLSGQKSGVPPSLLDRSPGRATTFISQDRASPMGAVAKSDVKPWNINREKGVSDVCGSPPPKLRERTLRSVTGERPVKGK